MIKKGDHLIYVSDEKFSHLIKGRAYLVVEEPDDYGCVTVLNDVGQASGFYTWRFSQPVNSTIEVGALEYEEIMVMQDILDG